MNTQDHPLESRELAKWLWGSAAATLVGYAGIVATVFLNASTLFDYQGQNPGPSELSGLELVIVLEFVMLGLFVGFLLWRAWKARRPAWFKAWHVLPITVAFSSFAMALFAVMFAVSETVH